VQQRGRLCRAVLLIPMNYESRNNGWVRPWLCAWLLGVASAFEVGAASCTVTMHWPSDWATCGMSSTAYVCVNGASCTAVYGHTVSAPTQVITSMGYNGAHAGGDVVSMTLTDGGDIHVYLTKSGCAPNGPPQYTNYSANFCITNKLGTYSYPNVMMHTAAGSTPLTEALDSLAPGAYRCFTVTNDVPFTITYGDTLFTADVPETTLYPSTNVTGTSHSPGTVASGPSGGPVVANPGSTNPSSGTNAVGGSSSLTQLDLNRAADAIIHSQAQNTARIVSGLEDVRDAINANTNGPGDTFDDSASLMSNVVNAAASSSVTASNAAPGSAITASNLLTGAGIWSAMNSFGGNSATGSVMGFLGDMSGSIEGDYRIVVPGVGGVTNQIIDLEAALGLAMLDGWLGGSGWRTWLRLVLVWGMVLRALMFYVDQLQTSVAQVAATSQLQVNSQAAGAFSLVPGANFGLRALVVAASVAAIAFLPSLIIALATAAFALGTGDSISTSLGYLAAAGGVPAPIADAFRMVNETLPLFESMVIFVNMIVARFLIAPATSFLCLLMKAIGV